MKSGVYVTKATSPTVRMNAQQSFYQAVLVVNTIQTGTKMKPSNAKSAIMTSVLTVMMQLMSLKILKQQLVNAINVEQERETKTVTAQINIIETTPPKTVYLALTAVQSVPMASTASYAMMDGSLTLTITLLVHAALQTARFVMMVTVQVVTENVKNVLKILNLT